MTAIGDHATTVKGFAGVVVDRRGTAGGRTEFAVTTLDQLPELRWIDEAALTVEPPPAPFVVGSSVVCYGQDCEVLAYDADNRTYDLVAMLRLPPGSGRQSPLGYVVASHHYPAVPAHHVELWVAGHHHPEPAP